MFERPLFQKRNGLFVEFSYHFYFSTDNFKFEIFEEKLRVIGTSLCVKKKSTGEHQLVSCFEASSFEAISKGNLSHDSIK